MTILLTSNNIKGEGAVPFSYDPNIKGDALLEAAATNLQLPNIKNMKILLRRTPDDKPVWVKPGHPLSHYKCKEGSSIILLNTIIPIAIVNTSGQTKKILIDLSERVDQIVPIVAEKLHLGDSLGFCLFIIEPDGSHTALDLELSIAQQSSNYLTLFFKRRFYLFTKRQIQDKVAGIFAFNDVKEHVTHFLTLPRDLIAQYIMSQLYASVNSPEEITQLPEHLEALCPPHTVITPDIRTELAQLMTAPRPHTREDAIEKFLSVAHEIPLFGCIKYRAKAILNSDEKKRSPIAVFVGPQDLLIKKEAEVIQSIPYFRLNSAREHKGKITLKFLDKIGIETEFSFKSKTKSVEILLLIRGYLNISNSLGAATMTDGFFKSVEDMSAHIVDSNEFRGLYTDEEYGYWRFYPGNTDELERFIEPAYDDLASKYPKFALSYRPNLEMIKEDSCNQDATLRLIRAVADLFEAPDISDLIDPVKLLTALFKVSTLNINIHTARDLDHDLELVLMSLKIIRKEMMTRVDMSRKNMIEGHVKKFKKHRKNLQSFIEQFANSPTDGATVKNVQLFLIEFYFDVQQMKSFFEPIVSQCPDPPILATAWHLMDQVYLVLVPLISHDPIERLSHVVQMQQIQFYISIVFAAASVSLEDEKVSSNSDIMVNLNKALDDLLASMRAVQMTKMDMCIRPFCIDILSKANEQIQSLQHALLSCRPYAELITDITSSKLFLNSILYVRKQMDICIKTCSSVKIEPYRDIPPKITVKNIHDGLVDVIASFIDDKNKVPTDAESKALAEKVQQGTSTLKTLLTLLRGSIVQPSRSTLLTITRARTLLNDTISQIRKLSSIFADTALVHKCTSLVQVCDIALKPCKPDFDAFRASFKWIEARIIDTKDLLVDQEYVFKILDHIKESNYPDRETEAFSELRKHMYRSFATNEGNPNSQELKMCVDDLDIIMIMLNQLPANELVITTPLVIVPFVTTKHVYSMIDEFIPQITDVARYYNDLKRVYLFTKLDLFENMCAHWNSYFEEMSSQFDSNQTHEMTLLTRFKELIRKEDSAKMFNKLLCFFLADNKSLDMINLFFSNCQLIINKLAKPHISREDTTNFINKIKPILQQLDQQLQKVSKDDGEISDQCFELHTFINCTGMDDLLSNDAARQQYLADNLYSMTSDLLPLLKDQAGYASIANLIILLQKELAVFTELSMVNRRTFSNSRFVLNGLSIQEVSEICANMVGDEPIPDEQVSALLSAFRLLSANPDALPDIIKFATVAIKQHNPRDHVSHCLRVLIATQTNTDDKVALFRKMAMEYVLRAAKAAEKMKEMLGTVDPIDNPKAQYYRNMLQKMLSRMDFAILLETESFPSLLLKMNELLDLSVMAPLLAKEDPTFAEVSKDLHDSVLNGEFALVLSAYQRIEVIADECFDLSRIHSPVMPFIDDILELREIFKDPMLLLGLDSHKLQRVAQIYQRMETELVPILDEISDCAEAAQTTIREIKLLGDMIPVFRTWADPLKRASPEAIRFAVVSKLQQAQNDMQYVFSTLQTDVTKLPLHLGSAQSNIDAAILYGSLNPKLAPLLAPLRPKLTQICGYASRIFNPDDGYKADLGLQRTVPEMNDQIKAILVQIQRMDEPDYTEIPQALRIYSSDPVDAVLDAVKGTSIFDATSKIGDVLRDKEVDDKMQAIITGLEKLPNLLNVDVKQIREELKVVLQQIHDKVKAAMSSSSSEIDILSQIPEFVSKFIRILPEINESARSRLGLDPARVIQMIQNNEVINVYDETTLLMKFFTYIEMDDDLLVATGTECLVKMVQALDELNAETIHDQHLSIIALSAAFAQRGMNTQYLDNLIDTLKPLSGIVTEITEEGKTAVLQAKRFLIDMINAESMKLTRQIVDAQTIGDLIDIRTTNNLNARALVARACDDRHLLFVTSNMQLLAKQGLHFCGPMEFCAEFVQLYGRSLSEYSDYVSSQSKTALRTLKRLIDNLGDLIDDLSLYDTDQSGLSQLAQNQTKLLQTLVQFEGSIAHLNASFGSSKIPQIFGLDLIDQKESFNSLLPKFDEFSAALLEINTKQTISDQFKEIQSQLGPMISDLSSIGQNVELPELVKRELAITVAISKMTKLTLKMSDKIILAFDPTNANRLPPKFVMPPIPTDCYGVPIAEVHQKLLGLTPVLDQLQQKISHKLPTQVLVDSVLTIFDQTTEFITQLLRVSITSMNLKQQSLLTAEANTIAIAGEKLNRGAKAKCLGSLEWKQMTNLALADLTTHFEQAKAIANVAAAEAEAESQKFHEIRSKFVPIIERLEQIRAKITTSDSDDLRGSLLSLCSTALSSIHTALVFCMGQTTTTLDDVDVFLAKANGIGDVIEEIMSNTGDVEDLGQKLIEALSSFTGSTSATQVQDAMGAIINGAEKVIETSKRSKMAAKNVKPVDPEHQARTREKLMERLTLESRVLHRRWELEYQESKMEQLVSQ